MYYIRVIQKKKSEGNAWKTYHETPLSYAKQRYLLMVGPRKNKRT